MLQARWTRQLTVLSTEGRKKAEEIMAAKDVGARSLDGFKQLLETRFGNLVRAWRKGLDTSGDGKLSFTEFCNSCRAIGYTGNLKKLWNELDVDKSGFVSL